MPSFVAIESCTEATWPVAVVAVVDAVVWEGRKKEVCARG